jgi:hypothetical protein
LAGIPVERTIWTIRPVPCAGFEVLLPQDRVAPLALESIRFATRAELIESASEALAAGDPGLAARWYSAWRRRLAASRRAVVQGAAASPEARSRHAQELKEVERRQAELDEKFKHLVQLIPVAEDPTSPTDPLWQQAAIGATASGGFATLVKGDGAIQVGFRARPDPVEQQRGAAAAILLALAAIAWVLLPHPVLHRWGHLLWPALGLALGGVWWAWCTPSVLGLAIGLASSLAGLRQWLPRRYAVPAGNV